MFFRDSRIEIPQGFRVELDGVAAAVRAHPSVKHAVALLVDSQLWCFATPETIDKDAVLASVAKIQPYYAVPSQFMALRELPRTVYGVMTLVYSFKFTDCSTQQRQD